MAVIAAERTIFPRLGRLLEYPGPDYIERCSLAVREMHSGHPEAAAALERFLDGMNECSIEDLQEAYIRAFDVAPHSIPYVSVYLFGEDNFKRAELMAGLKARYDEHQIDLEGELPDHIGVILRNAHVFEEDEWRELVGWCFPGPLKEMIRSLTRANSSYQALLEAVWSVFAVSFPREFSL